MLGYYPTPLVPLRRLSDILGGPQIWMKRDDQTGLGFGGNKTRKLEHLIADAVRRQADVVLTAGAQQSNHCRQTAAACAAVGIECHLVLGGTRPPMPEGNLMLDLLFGATVHFTGAERKGESLDIIASELRRHGRRPYTIPYGGSNDIGAQGFADAVGELKNQMESMNLQFDRLVFASSSGGTHAGLMVGMRRYGLSTDLVGVAIDKGEAGDLPFAEHIANIANATRLHYRLGEEFSAGDVNLCGDYLGEGYGVVGPLEREAIALLAKHEGILLDPVYTGRAMGALLDMIRGSLVASTETILFWHTGGTPALFPYAADLLHD